MFTRRYLAPLRWLLVIALLLTLAPVRTARAEPIVHVVQAGETLFRIGLRYGVTWQTLMAVNGLTSITIYPGQSLVIPDGAVDAGTSPAPAAAPTAEPAVQEPAAQEPAAQEPAADPTQPPAPAADPAPATTGSTYVVQAGDALWLIAQRFRVTVNDLGVANGLYNPNWIYPGQALVIPGAAAAPEPVVAQPAAPAPAPVGRQLAVSGRGQALPLDCEARSAVDWAAFFGTPIDELEFFGRLPASDDPEAGFVGSVYGGWGQIPPNAYGVHAEPVAALLRAYGVSARAERNLSWEVVQAEIDAGRPVIAWVVGHVWNGTPIPYTAPSTGRTTTVAAQEHTVIVVGYGADTVIVLDGWSTYMRTRVEFMASWGVLGNMAIVR